MLKLALFSGLLSSVTAVDCGARLVRLQTSKDTTCGGGLDHLWPVGLPAGSCHGWRAVDPTGREHLNSANNIQCNTDGSFSFTQHAGNLDCSSGSGVLKTYFLQQCTQDIPPSLFTKATDLSCCSGECPLETPTVGVPGASIYLNGEICDGSTDDDVTAPTNSGNMAGKFSGKFSGKFGGRFREAVGTSFTPGFVGAAQTAGAGFAGKFNFGETFGNGEGVMPAQLQQQQSPFSNKFQHQSPFSTQFQQQSPFSTKFTQQSPFSTRFDSGLQSFTAVGRSAGLTGSSTANIGLGNARFQQQRRGRFRFGG